MNQRRWPCVTLEPDEMCEACAVVRVRVKCVSACNWVGTVSTSPSHSRWCSWLSAKPSLCSFCRRTIYKKNDSGWLSGLVVFEGFEVLDEATAPSFLVLERTRLRISILSNLFTKYQPTYRLANCAGSMSPSLSPRWWVPPAWALAPSRGKGRWLIC